MTNNGEKEKEEKEEDDYRDLAEPYAVFMIRGESVDPDEITAVLGISPTRCKKRGDPLGKKGRTWSIGLWNISSADLVESGNLEHHILWLLRQLEPVKEHLICFTSRDGVEVSFKVVFNLFVHEWDAHISSSLMKRIIDLNAHFKISIYYLEDLNERLNGEKPWN